MVGAYMYEYGTTNLASDLIVGSNVRVTCTPTNIDLFSDKFTTDDTNRLQVPDNLQIMMDVVI